MKWYLYLTRAEWEEIKAIVRDRAPKDKNGRPCCEGPGCKMVHGKLKKSRKGYLIPHWLHTVHKHGALMKSKNPDDYLALCDACHMAYDRQPDGSGWVPQYRAGYTYTTTGDLVTIMGAVGLELQQVGESWRWRIGNEEGIEESAALAIGSAVARLGWLSGLDRLEVAI